MKIVYSILNTWYAGGLTRVLANKANYLAEHGHEVFVVTTDQFGKGHFYPMSDKIKFIDLDIDYVGYDALSLFQKLKGVPLKMFRHRKKLRELLGNIQPDIAISFFGKELFILPFIKDGSKKILEAHSSHFTWLDSRQGRGFSGKIQNWLDIFMVRKFDRFIVLTEEDKPDWGKLNNIEVIPNANTFAPVESSSLENKTVLAAGRYGYQKNFEDLIKAWSIVHRLHPDWTLNIRGQGLEENLRPLADSLPLGSSVSMKHSNNMLEECLNSSIFVSSSRYEGFALVLLEAQSCGVPLVSYACKCGPRDIIIDGENGFLVEVGDVEGLAERIIRLIGDEPLRKRMGKCAKIYSKRFLEDAIMKKWTDLFSALADGKKQK
ncbi:MAG: glycosyltransferase family 4 protein [Dysgonamonadaceae bacterium]|jgi:glycosyltransferase involved in cell wall biosynthesis|nr:glycosyltransferase family 4 protein [Dysgonamonadaceae bacterium]